MLFMQLVSLFISFVFSKLQIPREYLVHKIVSKPYYLSLFWMDMLGKLWICLAAIDVAWTNDGIQKRRKSAGS